MLCENVCDGMTKLFGSPRLMSGARPSTWARVQGPILGLLCSHDGQIIPYKRPKFRSQGTLNLKKDYKHKLDIINNHS